MLISSYLIFLCGGGVLLSLLFFFYGRKAARHMGLVDHPGGRKDHNGAIPLIGGIGIVLVFTLLSFLSDFTTEITAFYPLLLAVYGLLVVGIIDDRRHIDAKIRFVIQIAVAAWMVFVCGAHLNDLGNLFGLGATPMGYWGGAIFTMTCFVLLMNALNMLDGVDGLLGGFLLAALGWLAFFWALQDGFTLFWMMIFLIAPLVGFLVFNGRYPAHPKAQIFMGDAGSLSLSVLLGYFAVTAAQGGAPLYGYDAIVPPVAVVWLLSVPIMDTFALFFVRVRQGRSPFSPDRLHLHHKLMDKGVPVHWISPLVFIITLLCGGIGYSAVFMDVPEPVLLYGWSAILLVYTARCLKTAKATMPDHPVL